MRTTKTAPQVLPSLSTTQLTNISGFHTPDARETMQEIMRMTPETDVTVKGIFRFLETPGGTLTFSFGQQYKGQKNKRYALQDGQVYEIPLSVKKHINGVIGYDVHAFLQDAAGNPIKGTGKRVQRCEFRSLD